MSAGSPTERGTKSSGIIAVLLDIPDSRAATDWLFGDHTTYVFQTIPGVHRSRTFEILRTDGPWSQRLLTILETDDIEASSNFRQSRRGVAAKAIADARGVTNRFEFVGRLLNDISH